MKYHITRLIIKTVLGFTVGESRPYHITEITWNQCVTMTVYSTRSAIIPHCHTFLTYARPIFWLILMKQKVVISGSEKSFIALWNKRCGCFSDKKWNPKPFQMRSFLYLSIHTGGYMTIKNSFLLVQLFTLLQQMQGRKVSIITRYTIGKSGSQQPNRSMPTLIILCCPEKFRDIRGIVNMGLHT